MQRALPCGIARLLAVLGRRCVVALLTWPTRTRTRRALSIKRATALKTRRTGVANSTNPEEKQNFLRLTKGSDVVQSQPFIPSKTEPRQVCLLIRCLCATVFEVLVFFPNRPTESGFAMENLRKPLAEMTSKLFLAARDMVQQETEEDDDNLILCPFAVTAGVATMLYCGADGDAKTHMEHNLGYKELFMGHSGPKDVMMAFREAFAYLTKRHHHDATCSDESVQYFQKHFRFDFLQRLYIQEGTRVHDDFLKDVKKYLHVDHRFVDFAADPKEAMKIIQKEITEEVLEDVDTTVPAELLDMDYRGPRIFVANGGYFEGSWEVPFDRKLTYMGKFKTARGHIKDMEFMTITDRFAFTESEKFGALMFELPYLQNEASLLFLLPVDKKITRPGKKTGLCGLLERSDAHTWAMMLTQKRMKTLQVSIPKFAVQCTYGLEQLMMQTGFKEVMDDCSNRGRMATGEVRVSEGFHKAAIEIDENGTFVTGEMHDQSPLRTPGNPHSREHDVARRRPVETQKFKDEPVVVVVDQPFLVAVRHNKSGLFVLSGSIGNP